MNNALLMHLGNIDQLAGVRLERLEEGNSASKRIVRVWNAGGLSFSVTPDHCLDLYDFSFRGINLAFHSKNGLNASAFQSTAGEFFSYWPGGMLATCGLDNVGSAVESDPMNRFPIHGRIGDCSANHFSSDARWENEDYVLRLSGTMRESRLYGRSLELRRQITTSLDAAEVTITDTITNLTDAPEPIFLLYHFNFGYPLLDKDARYFGPRSETSECCDIGDNDFQSMHAPVDGAAHRTFFHIPRDKGFVTAGLYQPKLRLAAYLRYDTVSLPYLLEWKCLKSHDYVLAIEPANCPAVNRESDLQSGKTLLLGAYESVTYQVVLGVAEGAFAEFLLNNNA
ncbi:MAG: aldose 1-epimerase family protein [Eubacteriales bacterium]|nr:aldose 1-epimerase family protein [Eubacteriales bacterium]